LRYDCGSRTAELSDCNSEAFGSLLKEEIENLEKRFYCELCMGFDVVKKADFFNLMEN